MNYKNCCAKIWFSAVFDNFSSVYLDIIFIFCILMKFLDGIPMTRFYYHFRGITNLGQNWLFFDRSMAFLGQDWLFFVRCIPFLGQD